VFGYGIPYHPPTGAHMNWDIVLSSGFLAFARHLGVLRAVEGAALPIEGVCGTSSGSLVGALWASGRSTEDIAEELRTLRPIQLMGGHWRIWEGVFSLEPLIRHLETQLPETFEELGRPFAVGVQRPDGSHALLSSGPLVPAVAASCAMPGIFRPISIGGTRFVDGGAADRLGLAAWRELRGPRPTLVHEVERTAGRDVRPDDENAVWIRTPRSRASFWNLRDFDAQLNEALEAADAVLGDLDSP